MKKLDLKTYRRYRLVDYIGVVFLVLLLLLIWQLSRGPIAMPFLKPYIIKALNHEDTQYQVTLDSVNLEFVRSIKPLRIIANNVVYRKNDDEIVVNAPKTMVSFSIKALLRGVIAPSSIEIEKPRVYIFTSYGLNKDKSKEVAEINQKKLKYYFDGMQDFLERFNSEDKTYPESYINDIIIKNAEVEFHEVDLGQKWTFSDVNYRFERGLTSLETEINALLKFDGVPSSLGLEAVYRPFNNKVALQLYFADFIPGNLLKMFNAKALDRNYRINVPLSGNINALVNVAEVVKNQDKLLDSLDTAIEKIKFDFEGGQGSIALRDEPDSNYDIASLQLSGEISGGLDKISIRDAKLDLGGQKAVLGIEATGLKDYILHSSLKKIQMTLTAAVDKLPVDDLHKRWPKFIAPDAWSWCRESLFDGEIRNAEFEFKFGYDAKTGKIGFTGLEGKALADGVSLDYLTGMPRITGIYGTVNFLSDKLKINLDKGVSDDIILNNGYVELYDLNKEDNFAKISLEAVGSITDVLKLIDHRPLGYTSEMGLNPEAVKGSATTYLDLQFELKEDLTPAEVAVNVKSELSDVVLNEIIEGKKIEAKKLDLEVTNDGMLISGVANFEGIPVNLLWDENFSDKAYKSKYQLTFNFDSNLKSKLGINSEALSAPYIRGSVPTRAVITTYAGDKMSVNVNGNLKSADIDYAFLGFKKNFGTEGTLTADLSFEKGNIKEIPAFRLSKPDFTLEGKVAFDEGGSVRLVDINSIEGPKTSARAKIEFLKQPQEKVKITVSGNSYNLSDFFERDEEDKIKSKQRRKLMKIKDAENNYDPQTEKDETEDVADTDINIAVSSLWTNPDVAIRNFAGSAKLRKGIGVEEMHLIGNFNSGSKNKRPSNLRLNYVPRPNKEHLLSIESNDAGSTLKFLRLYDYMRGGTLSINARRDADKKIIGHAKIRDFNIYNTPVLAKLLTVASFTGMVNLLTGEGLAFSHFDAPFEYRHNILKVNDGKAFGNVVGITANGTYNTRYQEFDVKGVVAPAYGLNTLIGSIPLIGSLLSGKDGTVFAANYSITGDIDEPDISINPLSALSPNSLKELFSSVFGNNDE